MTLTELADKFEKAGYGHDPIEPQDLEVVGLRYQKSFTSKFFGRVNIEGNWAGFCTFVYEKVTGKQMPHCPAVGQGFRSQFYGRTVAQALREKANDTGSDVCQTATQDSSGQAAEESGVLLQQ